MGAVSGRAACGALLGAAPLIALLLALSLATPAPSGGAVPYWPDASHLRYVAQQAGLDWRVFLAVAWTESQANLDPRLRAHACWRPGWRRPWCPFGRFQVLDSTAKERCPELNTHTYRGNTECAARILKEDTARYGVLLAIERYNAGSRGSKRYLAQVLAVVGFLSAGGVCTAL